MFAPVAGELRDDGAASVLVSLDPHYGQGATSAAGELGLSVVELTRPGGSLERRFYDRPAIAMWVDLARAWPQVVRLVRDTRPWAVVVGNDFGLIEKLFIRAARRDGIRTVLVQDGALGPRTRAAPVGLGALLRRLARRAGSRLLSALGLEHMASTEYGAGGTDVICLTGASAERVVRSRAKPNSRLVVTGQPRYDRLHLRDDSDGDTDARASIAIFTTPFDRVLRDPAAQRAQREIVRWAVRSAPAGGIVTVKAHPRERAADYGDTGAVVLGGHDDPAVPLRTARLAIIGASTMVEEAAIVGCPVVVPSPDLIGRSYERYLPSDPPYPRFGSQPELADLLDRLSGATYRDQIVAAQRAAMRDNVRIGDGPDAARLVADAIMRG